jgi:hypothetical protein
MPHLEDEQDRLGRRCCGVLCGVVWWCVALLCCVAWLCCVAVCCVALCCVATTHTTLKGDRSPPSGPLRPLSSGEGITYTLVLKLAHAKAIIWP